MFSCKEHYTREEVINMLESSNTDSVLTACKFISENKDTTYNHYLLKDPYQWKITHNWRFLGMNGYEGRMKTLRKVTGIAPPNKITYTPDSSIVEFYRMVLKE